MAGRLIAYAVPVFFLLIGLELLWSWRRGNKAGYRLADAITNLSCGVGQQLLVVAMRTALAVLYLWVYEQAHLLELPVDAVWTWCVGFLLVDCCYYWFHRAGHRSNLVWAGHVVHHQSEEYNLTVALRQSWFVGPINRLFYLPCALIGLPPEQFVTINVLITLYQFWIHTEAIGRLGPLEWIFNTPSHHRVHHGVNPKYIDRNYAGLLILWDRLFGTFQAEQEQVVYGTVKPLASWNPWWANVHVWVEIWRLMRRCSSLRHKLWIWFAPPEWRPAELGGDVVIPEVSRATRPKFETPRSAGLSAYVLVQFGGVLVGTTLIMLRGGSMEPAALCAAIGLGLVSLLSFGALFEGRRWAPALEAGRLVSLSAGLVWIAYAVQAAWLLSGLVAAPVFGLWLWRLRADFEGVPAPAEVAAPAAGIG